MLSFATILRGPDLFIFSKLADCNLFEMLTGKCEDFSQLCSTFTPLDFIQESYCLVGALKFLHHGLDTSSGRMFCAHMDLKPENVLVSWRQRRRGQHPVGLWQIADFGISKIKRPRRPTTMYLEPLPLGNMAAQVAGLEMTPTAPVRGSGAFQAPEVVGNANRTVGQESDMWSFGCILASVLCFASGGPMEVGRLYKSRDTEDQDYFYDTKLVGDREVPCVKPQFVSYFNQLGPNESWLSSSKALVYELLRVDPQYRWKAERTQTELGRISDAGVQTRRGSQICLWQSQFPMSIEPAGKESIHIIRPIQRLPTREPAAPEVVQGEVNRHLRRQGPGPADSGLEVPVERVTRTGVRPVPTHIEPAGLEPVQTQTSIGSGHSDHRFRRTTTTSSPGGFNGSPRASLTSQLTPRTPQERLNVVVQDAPFFVKLERPPDTKRSRLCPSAKTIVFVSDRLLRIYALDFLSETRRWERERRLHSVRTIVAADIPSSSQGVITWPSHLRNVATSVAGDFIAVLLKPMHDRQHEVSMPKSVRHFGTNKNQVRLHKFSGEQTSLQNPSTCSLLSSEPITGILHVKTPCDTHPIPFPLPLNHVSDVHGV
jgi:serine/threonine protein kinase